MNYPGLTGLRRLLVAGLLCLGPASAAAAPQVLASIPPLQFIALEVMRGVAQPEVLLSGRESPHDHALKPSDMRRLQAAGTVLWVGPELERGLDRPLGARPAGQVLTALRLPGVRLLPLTAGIEGALVAGAQDPHLWLDPDNAAAIALALAERLGRQDAAHAAAYTGNARQFQTRLESQARTLAQRLAPLRSQSYLVWHGAYGYFSRRFGLKQAYALSDHPEAGLSARRLSQWRARIQQESIACVFTEPQFSATAARNLVSGTGARVAELDPLGAALTAEPGAYERLLDNLATAFEGCLRG
jgi:zinc transport system substrate-binding protein